MSRTTDAAVAGSERSLLARLETLSARAWRGLVYRHVLGHEPPSHRNRSGARWNPRGLPAVYVSLDPETALAEAEPSRPKSRRSLYEMLVELDRVVDLRAPDLLAELGIPDAHDQSASQRLGAAIAALGSDGALVPSARTLGTNLVIYPQRDDEFEIVSIRTIGDAC